MEFANKEYLFLLLLLIPYILWYLMRKRMTEPTLKISDTRVYKFAPRSWKVILMPVLFIFRIIFINDSKCVHSQLNSYFCAILQNNRHIS